MKLLAVIYSSSFLLMGGPVFWDHPNVKANFLEPISFVNDEGTINVREISWQSPQNHIWYDGRLVGYFANEWKAPTWTTPQVDYPMWYDEAVPSDIAAPQLPVPPNHSNPPGSDPRLIFDPAVLGPIPDNTSVPEPGTLGAVGLGIGGLIYAAAKRRITLRAC